MKNTVERYQYNRASAIICDGCGEYIWPGDEMRACEGCERLVHSSCWHDYDHEHRKEIR